MDAHQEQDCFTTDFTQIGTVASRRAAASSDWAASTWWRACDTRAKDVTDTWHRHRHIKVTTHACNVTVHGYSVVPSLIRRSTIVYCSSAINMSFRSTSVEVVGKRRDLSTRGL